jgi:hypothetical protein
VGQAITQHELCVQALGVASVAGHERHDQVGIALLWTYERGGVGLAPVELGEHLVGRVAAP